MAHAQVTKPAAKTAKAPAKTAAKKAAATKAAPVKKVAAKTTPAPKTTAKTAQKPAPKAQTKAAPKTANKGKGKKTAPTTGGARFYVKDGFRPGAGGLLASYTFAWLQETGLIDGGAIARADAVKIAGATAVGYHTNKTGNFVNDGGRLRLRDAAAANHFADRATTDDVEAYRAVLREGTPNAKYRIQDFAIGTLTDQK